MEASALQLRQGIVQGAGVVGGSLLRLRSDEQLVALFRAGNDEAFRVIHDRYRKRLLAYSRQMLAGSGQDAEDALQDVFERAYSGLRASDRELALKAWLYRVAHNRCIDQLRRPGQLAAVTPDEAESHQPSPAALAEQRETLRRLIVDVQRLPDQQRSALLLREMSGMSYAELAATLGLSVPAVKSLLVRARVGLLAASEARDTACSAIREELVLCHDRGVRPSGRARRHLRDCEQCSQFRRSVRGVSRTLAAIAPVGPIGILVKLLGGSGAAGSGGVFGSGGAAAGGATAGGAVAGGAVGGGAIVSTGAVAGGLALGAPHVTALLAAALATAGGAVAVQQGATQTHATHHPVPAHHVAAAAMPYSGGGPIVPAPSSPVAPRLQALGQVKIAAPGSSLTAIAKLGTSSKGAAKGQPTKTQPPSSSALSSISTSDSSSPGNSPVTASTPAGTTSSTSSTTGSSSTSSSGATTPTATTSGAGTGTPPSDPSSGGAAITGGPATGGSGTSSASGSTSGN